LFLPHNVYILIHSYTKQVRSTLDSSVSPPSIVDILKAIADDKALNLFNKIALADKENGCIPSLKEMQLSVKQYYSRMSALMKAGLIKRNKGNYHLTILGKTVYDAHISIGIALNYYRKLKVLESIQLSSSGQLTKEEFINLVDILIDNHQIKDMLYQDLNNTAKYNDKPVMLWKKGNNK
jgi:predicted transcriptional regulator